MPAMASTGTFVALVGGTGVLIGAIVSQGVQLFRDQKQYKRDDAKHDRARQQALEDSRTARREDRYVAVLQALSRFDRALKEYRLAITRAHEWARSEEEDERPDHVSEELANHLYQLAEQEVQLRARCTEAYQDASDAVFAAYPTASKAARHAGDAFTSAELTYPAGESWLLSYLRTNREWKIYEVEKHVRENRPAIIHLLAFTDVPLSALMAASRQVEQTLRTELHLD